MRKEVVMFEDGAAIDVVGGADRAASYHSEWRAVHQHLCDLARRRVALEAEETTYLLEAEELHVFKRLGYRTMVEYMTGELGYTRHAALERLRVSRELVELPKLRAAFHEGDLCFSKVRELTRVATLETEAAFLLEAQSKDSHQVARMVSGLKRGDLPDAVPDPALVTKRMVFELHAEALGMLASRTKALRAQLGREPTHDELMIELCTGDAAASGPTGDQAAPPPPSTQQIVVTCKRCDRSELIVEGEALAIDEATAERLLCDATVVGDAESDDRTRVSPKIPAALRRKVFIRDQFRCVVPGCTARRHLVVHHLQHREHGGTHTMPNLCVLCFHHHKLHHDGALDITGAAPHRLEFRWYSNQDDEHFSPRWDDSH